MLKRLVLQYQMRCKLFQFRIELLYEPPGQLRYLLEMLNVFGSLPSEISRLKRRSGNPVPTCAA